MATKRMIKTTVVGSKKMRRLKDDTTRLLFLYLCLLCDDDGKLDGDLDDIRVKAFAGRDEFKICDVEEMLTNLGDVGLIIYYENNVSKERIIYIPFWTDTNKIPQTRYKASVLPDYNPDEYTMLTKCLHDVDILLHRVVKNRKEKKSTSDASLRCANRLFNGIKKHNPNSKLHTLTKKQEEKKLYDWSVDIDRMILLDKRTEPDIIRVIDFATNDDFWSGNILSGSKLRKQFDQLYVKSNKSVGQVSSDKAYKDVHALFRLYPDSRGEKLKELPEKVQKAVQMCGGLSTLGSMKEFDAKKKFMETIKEIR